MLIHADHVRTVNDSNIGREAAARDLLHECLIADEDQLVIGVCLRPGDPSGNNLGGTVIAPHCIQCKADAA